MGQTYKIIVNGSVIDTCTDIAQGISKGQNWVGHDRRTYGYNVPIQVKDENGTVVGRTTY